MVLVELDYANLEVLLKDYGYDYIESSILAEYITECVTYKLEFNSWIGNTPFKLFPNGDIDEVHEYIKDCDCDIDDCIIYHSDDGFYVELCY